MLAESTIILFSFLGFHNMNRRLITAALPYVNNIPHLGNIIQSLSGDVLHIPPLFGIWIFLSQSTKKIKEMPIS